MENINIMLEVILKLCENDIKCNTKNRTLQLYYSYSNSTILVCLFVIAEYCSILKSVTNEVNRIC